MSAIEVFAIASRCIKIPSFGLLQLQFYFFQARFQRLSFGLEARQNALAAIFKLPMDYIESASKACDFRMISGKQLADRGQFLF